MSRWRKPNEKKIIVGKVGCISLAIIFAGEIWGISIYRRECDTNWRLAKKLFNVESALQEIDEIWKLQSLTQVTPYCY